MTISNLQLKHTLLVTMTDYPELNLLLRRIYRYETELLGGGSGKQSELEILKQAIANTIRDIKQSVNERNEMRVKKEKLSTTKMLKLTNKIKEDIGQVERMVKDFETMLNTRKLNQQESARKILHNFNEIVSKLKESENEYLSIGEPQADKFANINFGIIIRNTLKSRL